MNFKGLDEFSLVVLLFLLQFDKLQVQIEMSNFTICGLFCFENSAEDGMIKDLFLELIFHEFDLFFKILDFLLLGWRGVFGHD